MGDCLNTVDKDKQTGDKFALPHDLKTLIVRIVDIAVDFPSGSHPGALEDELEKLTQDTAAPLIEKGLELLTDELGALTAVPETEAALVELVGQSAIQIGTLRASAE